MKAVDDPQIDIAYRASQAGTLASNK